MFDIDKQLLIKVLKGAGERVGKAAVQSLLKAAHEELARAENSLEPARDRITAAVCHDIASILEEEFGKVKGDLARLKGILNQR